MLKIKQIVSTLLAPILLIGCSVTNTTAIKPQSSVIKASSTSTIISNKELEYARLYQLNKYKSGTQDAIESAKSGIRTVKVIYSGRGSTLIPAFEEAPKNCEFDAVEGMGDVIYGENHMKYRKLMRIYAKDFNQIMTAYCQ